MTRASRAAGRSILLASLFLLWSCSEGSLLVPDLSESEEPAVETLEAGSSVSSTDTIPISILPGNYSLLEIRLLTLDGEERFFTTYDGAILGEPRLPDLPVPDLEEGSYTLDLRLFEAGQEVARQESLVFITDALLDLVGITLYPPSSQTEAELLAEATIRRGEDSLDPFIRWRFDGEVVAEGLLSDLGQTVRIAVGEETGVFQITAELFPWAPAYSGSYEFTSPVIRRTDVAVRPQWEDDEAWVRYTFDGHLRPAGDALEEEAAPGSWQLIGEPELSLEDELFGFLLDDERGFYLPEPLFPESDGALLPVRFELSFALLTPPVGATPIFATGNGNGGVTIGADDQGALFVGLFDGEQSSRVELPPGSLAATELVTVAVELYPGEEQVELFVYVDGELEEIADLPVSLAGGTHSGESTVSGTMEEFIEEPALRGAVIQPLAGAVVLIDDLTVSRPADDEVRAEQLTLEAGELLEVRLPATRGESLRYTLVPGRAENVELSLLIGADDDQQPAGTLTSEGALSLTRRDDTVFYAFGDDEPQGVAGESLYLRHAGEGEPIKIRRTFESP